MKKDVIYIDVEDDITAIIGKVKASKEKVVVLVPPKRIGVLQSAVNLRLLNRAAKQGDKHLALVTSNHALVSLAAAAGVPVAKNLQSKPELAEVPALSVDDDNDIIDGGSLPVGEHVAASAKDASEAQGEAMARALAQAPKDGSVPAKPKAKSGAKVPNFNKFRKKLVLGIGAGVLLIAFLVWAFVFAPRATVVISAKTSASAINIPVTISPSATSSADKNTIKAIAEQKSENKSTEVIATGKKDDGEKATGTVEFSTGSLAGLGTIPAGTKLTSSSGLVFTTDSSVTLVFTGNTTSSGSTTITAVKNGSSYNAATGNMSGAPSGVTATLTGPTSGGVTKMVTVLTAGDVQKAKEKIAEESTTAVRDELKGQFADGALVLDESFKVTYGDAKTSVAVGEEADKATLSSEVTYRMYAVEKTEVENFLDAYLSKELKDQDDQRVYKNGADDVQFENVSAENTNAKATVVATAQIGPKIDDKEIKEQVKGKRYGEIQQTLEAVQGIDAVDVKFFPFWVSAVPNDPSRITIEFKLDESK